MLYPKRLMEDTESELFNYTTGRFLVNEALRLRERRHVFNIPGLFKIIAKLGEGGLNRTFLVTFDSGPEIVARIPYSLLTPKTYTLASEAATMNFLRSKGLPIPEIFAYSFVSNNEAQMESSNGEIALLMDQLAELESIMMSISFPVGGSIYYAEDLKTLSGNTGIPLEGPFCIGPDVSMPLWYGRREQLDVFRGPYKDAKSVMIAGAEKELAYLDREHYDYKKQPPSDHAENLHHYLRLAPSLVPDDDAFCIRHPDLSDSNVKVSKDSRRLRIRSMLDWQHAVVLPLFLHAGMPDVIQNEEDEVSRSMVEPELPGAFDQLSKEVQDWERELLRRRLVHYHYNLSTAAYNRIHHNGLVYPFNPFRRHIFNHATAAWEGETIKLRYALIDMVLGWARFAKGDAPCPVVFTEDEKAAAEKLYRALAGAEKHERMLRDYAGYAEETWVPAAHYEKAKAFSQEIKRMTLEAGAQDEEVREEAYAVIKANWPLDDMEEEELEEYK
ncbi:hypothetical protein HYPSUDRAFT_209415 [Hypholoma sublateritium FD-334 SS-4]|uniref:Uncharacterized protein n=1 Tax=Hypholoma sublateritium (strain FD-334 SS-4) TaxID=945553 RepID=A0A0D2NYS2_HYPSF|nr:hypothetical protein HYPSUDRAFT_209415 [Hypholoma sublateritium FD-334 SS-4]